MAPEESSDAVDAAMSELECLAGGIQATVPLVERRIREPHRVFDNSGIGVEHMGFLPGERDFQSQNLPTQIPCQKAQYGTVNKFQLLTSNRRSKTTIEIDPEAGIGFCDAGRIADDGAGDFVVKPDRRLLSNKF